MRGLRFDFEVNDIVTDVTYSRLFTEPVTTSTVAWDSRSHGEINPGIWEVATSGNIDLSKTININCSRGVGYPPEVTYNTLDPFEVPDNCKIISISFQAGFFLENQTLIVRRLSESANFSVANIDGQNCALIALSQVCLVTKPLVGVQLGSRLVNRKERNVSGLISEAIRAVEADGGRNVVIELNDNGQLFFDATYES